MEETAVSAETTSNGSAFGAHLSDLLNQAQAQAQDRRRLLGGWTLIAATAGWVVAFLLSHQTWQTLPWSVALLSTSAVVISWLYGHGHQDSLSLFKLGGTQPLRTAEGLAVSLVSFSCVLAVMLFVYKNMPQTVNVRRQIVDIEFVSGSDAVNRHDPLPGTQVQAEQKKVSSNALIAAHGTTFSPARVPVVARQATTVAPASSTHHPTPLGERPASQVVALPKNNAAPSGQNAQSAGDMFIEKPIQATQLASAVPSSSFATQYPSGSKWVTKTISPLKHSEHLSSRATQALEEVAPPELVELTDTQGESRATEAWQTGGHSSGGKGAQSPLSVYLKELHKRIKRAWSPPKGETRTAEILFRIRRSGQLDSIKLVRHSGNEESDEAAIQAIASCSPFKPLPDVITNDYLDLEYTFNYTVDRLSELPGQKTE